MKRLVLFVLVIAAAPSLFAAKAGSAKETKVEDFLKVEWESIQYNRNVTVYNPAASSSKPLSNSNEGVQVSCNVQILDPNVILGTCTQAVVTEITDGKGQVISSGPALPNTGSMTYRGLRYNQKIVRPKRDPAWKVVLESVLRIRRQTSTSPQWVLELQPNSLQIQLDRDILEKTGGQIGSIKGYFYALSAKSLNNKDLPLEPNDSWIQLTDNQQILIKEVQHSGSSLNYRIDTRWVGGNRPFSIKVSDYLPNQIITAQRFVKDDGSQSNIYFGSSQLPAIIGGGGSIGGGDAPQITTIRFTIAEDPNHNKIPFELKNIPVPKP